MAFLSHLTLRKIWLFFSSPVYYKDDGASLPVINGCGSGGDQQRVDVSTNLARGDNPMIITWNVPSATPAGTPVRTHNGLNSGFSFGAGLTEFIYIFGNLGAESTCTWRLYVLSM